MFLHHRQYPRHFGRADHLLAVVVGSAFADQNLSFKDKALSAYAASHCPAR
jgi:hypothetical protein